ncbi:MAG: acyl carrier protein [Lachnospiraceae bacterium]|nr:acyl carrier protein [Lachnospiraceae bacterium]
MEFDLLKDIIAEVLNVDPAEITRETTFEDDLGADSLDLFQIIMGIEEKLNLEVDTDAIENVKSVGEAEELIKSTLGR